MLIFKGIIIGIGKIIPGVSGSMLAISLGIYQKLINSVNNFFNSPKENFKFLFKIAIGVIISIVFFSNIILNSLDKYYTVTMFFFVGLIIGGLDEINENIEVTNKPMIFVSCTLVTLFGLFNIDNEIIIHNNILNFIYFLFIGFVDAITTIIPGISGTATLMMLGAYKTLIKSFSTILDFYYLQYNLRILIPFSIGMFVGIILIVKLVQFLFKHYKSKTYSSILGFSMATIIIMCVKSFNSFYTFKDLIVAFMLLLIGVYITKKINHIFNG